MTARAWPMESCVKPVCVSPRASSFFRAGPGACARPAGTSTATIPKMSTAHFRSPEHSCDRARLLNMGSLDETGTVWADVHRERSGLPAEHRARPEIRRHLGGTKIDGNTPG